MLPRGALKHQRAMPAMGDTTKRFFNKGTQAGPCASTTRPDGSRRGSPILVAIQGRAMENQTTETPAQEAALEPVSDVSVEELVALEQSRRARRAAELERDRNRSIIPQGDVA
jgi:hypothetical protein